MPSEEQITDLETCLRAFGVEKPFNVWGELTERGYKAYNKLRDVLFLMEEFGVIANVDEDKLDRIVSEIAY